MKACKKKLGMLMALLLTFLTASAYDFEIDGLYYDVESLSDMTCRISGGKPDLTKLSLPSSITVNGRTLKVTMVSNSAWYKNLNITEVEFAPGLDSIGSEAFSGCKNISSINLGSIKGIGSSAFYNCPNISSISFPSSVTYVGDAAFALPSTNSLNSTELSFVKGTENLSFDKSVFDNRMLSKIHLDRNLKNWEYAPAELTIGPNVTIFPSCMGQKLTECDLSKTNISIIDDHAFGKKSGYSSPLKSIALPAQLDSIGLYAFYYTNIQEINLPSTLRSIGACAFEGTPLRSITLPSTLSHLGNAAFYDCSLTEINIPGSIKSIGYNTFAYSNLSSVKIGEGISSIGANAFQSTNLKNITLPSSLTTIGYNAFFRCKNLEAFTIPSNVEFIGYEAFSECSHLNYLCFEKSENPLYFEPALINSETLSKGASYKSEEEAAQHPWVYVNNYRSPFMVDNLTEVRLSREIKCAIEKQDDDKGNPELITLYKNVNSNFNYQLYVPNSNLETLWIGEEGSASFLTPEQEVVEFKKYNEDSYSRIITQINYTYTYNLSPTVYPANLQKLKTINCNASVPPVLDSDFPTGVYISAVVNVPPGAKEVYQAAPYWKNFWAIQEKDFNGVDKIYADSSINVKVVNNQIIIDGKADTSTCKIYNLQGVNILSTTKSVITDLASGIYIVRVGDRSFKIAIH